MILRKLTPWLAALLIGIAHAASEDELLPPDQAFRLTTSASATTLEASWRIAPGYYLYRDKFKFEALDSTLRLGAPAFPTPKSKQDPFFGRTEIYTDRVSVTVPIERVADGEKARVRISFQGCNEPIGVCYPPMSKEVTLDLPQRSDAAGLLSARTGGGRIDDLLAPKRSANEDQPVDPEIAFRVDALALDDAALGVRFAIADCCYLYRDKTRFALVTSDGAPLADGAQLGRVDLPPGEVVQDEYFGRTAIYRGGLDVVLPLRGGAQTTQFALDVTYQGCAEKGVAICYEPITRRFPIQREDGRLTVGSATLVSTNAGAPGGGAVNDTTRGGGALLLAMLGAFGAGLLLTFTPCVLPMIPILSGALIGAEGARLTRLRGGLLSYTYVLGTALTYTAAGAIAGATGEQLQAYFQNPWALGLFSALLVLFALSMFGLYELRMPARVQSFLHHHSHRVHRKSKRGSAGEFIGVFMLGALSALIIGACVTPILASTLTVAIASQDVLLGAAVMFALAHGQGAILVAIGVSEGSLLPRSGPWMSTVKHVFGVLLIAVAIYLLGAIPQVPVLLLWGALLIVCAVYLGATQALPKEVSGWRYLWKGVGTFLLVWGVLALIGGFAGRRDLMQPWPSATQSSTATTLEPSAAKESHALFKRVAPAELGAVLADARQAGKPVVLDYYATWCTDCVRMEQTTFLDPRVQAAIAQRFVALQVDVTEANADTRAAKQRFNVFGPPALLFIDAAGNERRDLRAYGYLSSDEIIGALSRL